jgi:hypothetical protein
LALLVNETTDIKIITDGDESAESASVDNTKFYPGTDFGLVFGAGLELQNFLLDVRYDLGLSSVLSTGSTSSLTPANQVFSALLGYRIF